MTATPWLTEVPDIRLAPAIDIKDEHVKHFAVFGLWNALCDFGVGQFESDRIIRWFWRTAPTWAPQSSQAAFNAYARERVSDYVGYTRRRADAWGVIDRLFDKARGDGVTFKECIDAVVFLCPTQPFPTERYRENGKHVLIDRIDEYFDSRLVGVDRSAYDAATPLQGLRRAANKAFEGSGITPKSRAGVLSRSTHKCARLKGTAYRIYGVYRRGDDIRMASEPYKTMFWIVAETGIRGGELCGLGVSDVDLQNRVIKVWRSAWRGKLQTPKTTNAVRHFPISANLADHIRQYLGTDWKTNPDGLLFCTRTGKPLDNYNVVTWQLKPLLERIGVTTRRMGLHAFRHCNATELDRMGAPIKVRQDRLGHADSETTFGYTHAESADHRRVAAELGRIFDPSMHGVSDAVSA